MNDRIFSPEFLESYLVDFRLKSVTNIDHKMVVLKKWRDSIRSSKVNLQKEEETKSIFIQDIFCDILGFDSKNPNHWQVREEFKSIVGATKPDAALGSFKIENKKLFNEVHVVVEIKNANTNLDEKQNRKDFTGTPVDQAFLYASKMGGNCKWVVVSNLIEIRFYHYSSQNTYQSYQLAHLSEEELLKELLFLFHKDRLTNTIHASTDKLFEIRKNLSDQPSLYAHIIDQMHHALHRFEGLNFIDPDFIANMKPFNLENHQVWHFEKGRLLTLNPDISELLAGITVQEHGLNLSKKVLAKINKAKVLEPELKLTFILKCLHSCLISEICAPKNLIDLSKRASKDSGFSLRHFHFIEDDEMNITSTKIQVVDHCNCINCTYRKFDFKSMIKSANDVRRNIDGDPLEEAYMQYLLATDNYKAAYFTYKKAEIITKNREKGSIKYFISKINQMHLHNLVEGFGDAENNLDILDDIRSIDLDHSIHNELDMYVDADVRRYLIEIKEDKLFTKVRKKVAEIIARIKEGNDRSDDLSLLQHNYNLLYSHFHKNYLVFDAFTDFKQTVNEIIAILINKFKNKEIKYLNEFYLVETILYVDPSTLRLLLANCPDIVITNLEKETIVTHAANYLQSFFIEGSYGAFKEDLLIGQLLNSNFQSKIVNFFSNTFQILSKISFESREIEPLTKPLVNFMNTQEFLSWDDLQSLGNFLERYGYILKEFQLEEMLKKAVEGDKYGTHRYHKLTESLCKTLHDFYPNYKIADQSLGKRAVANNTDHNGKRHINHLIHLRLVLDDNNLTYLISQFVSELEQNFDGGTFRRLVHFNIIPWSSQDYFIKYIKEVNKLKRVGFSTFNENGEPHFTDLTMINFILHLYNYDIDRQIPELGLLKNLSDFEQWAIYPDDFDYDLFDPRWLLAFPKCESLKLLKGNSKISTALQLFLKRNYHERLSKLYFCLLN